MGKRSKDPFNEENGEFRAMLNYIERKKSMTTMRFLGIDSRTTLVKLALSEFNKNKGIPHEEYSIDISPK